MIGRGGLVYSLSAALAVPAAVGSLLTFLFPDVLRGTAVMNGSARGTALVVMLGAVPVITWLGALAFLLYNSLMFLLLPRRTTSCCFIWPCWPCACGTAGVLLQQTAGFIEAHNIHPGQSFDRGELLYQHATAGQCHRRRTESDGGQQHQPLGDHADQRGDG
jgi:hypothetical protein